MPYVNIHWVKLKFLDLLTDPEHRFLEKLNDEQKGLFLMLFMLMGYYKNSIPDSVQTIKRTLNLSQKDEKIAENLEVILQIFPKTVRSRGFLKFKNYSKLHNPLGKSEGYPKDSTGGGVEKSRVEKSRLEELISFYGDRKGVSFSEKNQPYWLFFKRNARPARELILACNDMELAKKAILGIGKLLEGMGRDWTLDTILKWYPDWSAKGEGLWGQKKGQSDAGLRSIR